MVNKGDLLFDVRARVKIANLCKDKRFENIQMLFDCSEEERIKNILIMLKILSNSAEYAKRKAQGLEVNVNADYNAIPITLDDMYDMKVYEIGELENLIVEVIGRDSERTVEAKDKKGKKKEA